MGNSYGYPTNDVWLISMLIVNNE